MNENIEDDNLENVEPIEFKETDVSEKECYALPLSPQDLVAIYKDKGDDEDYVLWVDYANSRLKLSAKHIMIYLANTNFKSTFAAVDDELLIEYIKSDFLVDSPLLGRIITNIIKVRFGHELSDLEKELYALFDEQKMHDFIRDHWELLEEVIENIQSIVPFILVKLYDNMSEEDQLKEIEFKETLDEIAVNDEPSNCGPNIPMMIKVCWDAFLAVTHYKGLSLEYNKQLFNDAPKYFGKDLFFVLNQSNVVREVLKFFPPGFFQVDLEAKE